ncbi:MAG: cysteine desulfurase [Deltaproteobacteria bacterium]|nr:cysteine desulfurase [Deltaproteobacteria bacterium]
MSKRDRNHPAVYLDYAATTPVDPEVLEEMLPYFSQHFGNPGSRIHSRGLTAETAVDTARERVASLLGARPLEITFTSGATESNNLALVGVAAAWNYDCDLLISASEHPSVAAVAQGLVDKGVRLQILPVGTDGRVSPGALDKTLETLSHRSHVLVSVMHASNETGVIHPVEEIGALCRRHGAVFHCDASQSVGKIPVKVNEIGADLLSLSAHKFYGPKGVGALYVRRQKPRIPLLAQANGGAQERGLRSGTLNVPGIVGMGVAATVALQRLAPESAELRRLTRLMVACLREHLSGVEVNGSLAHRLPSFLNLSFADVPAERLQQAIRPLAEISAGSACGTGKIGPSPGLLALGLPASRADGAVRIVLGRFTTEDDVHRAIDAIVPAVLQTRRQQTRQDRVRQDRNDRSSLELSRKRRTVGTAVGSQQKMSCGITEALTSSTRGQATLPKYFPASPQGAATTTDPGPFENLTLAK